ncbi:MAG: hypothetical protein SFX73_07760 [Kofleriaceae bacterium]|nr:hypothetical protein [Kofleriaceae bacterium]
MRTVVGAALVGLVSACSSSGASVDPSAPIELPFGPYTIEPGEEVDDQCVQISLHNEDYLFVNSVELATGPGFHHSNWLYVPEHVFAGEDGTYTCDDRGFDQAVAAIFGGVLFAQSTQVAHEVQTFPPGVVIKIPPHSKLVSTIHLLNPTDGALSLAPAMTLAPIAEADVTTELAGISFLNQALALPASMHSKFTLECDIGERHRYIFGRDPDFNIYYALAHYHDLGTALTVEAVRPDGTASTVFTTANKVGDALGGPIAPLFSMQGYTKLRFSCEFFNPRADVVRWGVGDQEMCVFLAFTDSTYNFGGGVTAVTEPENPQLVGNTMTYSNPCNVFANDARR